MTRERMSDAQMAKEVAGLRAEGDEIMARWREWRRETATGKQVAANRRNAQKSTGPVTPEGRAKAARNALRHGLFSSRDVVAGESRRRFIRFARRMFERLAPMDELEVQLASRLVSLLWRLRRISGVERDLLAEIAGEQGAPAEAAMRIAEACTRIRRHETQIDRSVFRTWRELREVQAAREQGAAGVLNELMRRLTERSQFVVDGGWARSCVDCRQKAALVGPDVASGGPILRRNLV